MAEKLPGEVAPLTASIEKYSCAAHSFHSPAPTYLELHHVIPQSWQLSWQPHEAGRSELLPLWDQRTVALCRTGHGNVHVYLVEMMRWLSQFREEDQVRAELYRPFFPRGVLKALKRPNRKEVAIAKLGITRFAAEGGPLRTLIDRRLLGYI